MLLYNDEKNFDIDFIKKMTLCMIAIDKFSMFSSSLKLKGNKTNLENDETTKINVPKIFDIKTNEQKLGNNNQLQKSKDKE